MPLVDVSSINCAGCRACEQICPRGCIRMIIDDEGFMHAHISENECLHCEKCVKICPVQNCPHSNEIKNVYAAQLKDESILLDSSSGGMFRLVADYVIEHNGVVCGCQLDHNNKAIFTCTNRKENLKGFQGSKYVSSDTQHTFSEVKQFLSDGRIVLFVGAPCQCAGLINYLGKDFDNLITMDFLCHGMPSQWIFDEYVKYLEKGNNRISNIHFRDKSARGWGLWFSYSVERNVEKKIIKNASIDPYLYAFQRGMMNRSICYSCPFQGKRVTDITIADYWGIEEFYPNIERSKGVSILSINSSKAETILELCEDKVSLAQSCKEDAAKQNESLISVETRFIPDIRKSIYINVKKNGWKKVRRDVLDYRGYWFNKIWYSLPHSMVKKIKRKK